MHCYGYIVVTSAAQPPRLCLCLCARMSVFQAYLLMTNILLLLLFKINLIKVV